MFFIRAARDGRGCFEDALHWTHMCERVAARKSPGSNSLVATALTCTDVGVMDGLVFGLGGGSFPATEGRSGGPAPVCPHVYPSASGLGALRCGLKDGEPGMRW